jgi:putative transposase
LFPATDLKSTVCCYRFQSKTEFANILLTDHTVSELSKDGVKARSFTITPTSLSISIQKDVTEIKPEGAIGIDRNLRNVTISTPEKPIMYRTGKVLSIKENSQYVRASFRRFDRRVKNRFFTKLRGRQTRRVNQYLHKISKHIVEEAKRTKSMIVFEDSKGIRRLYKKGNGQGKKFRRIMNITIPNYEIQRQVTYKAVWEGIPVYFVNPKRTSKLCPICGGRLQEGRLNRRKLWCNNYGKLLDRDVIASMNIANKGWARFTHPRGLPDEAVKGNVTPDKYQEPLILRVNGSKLVARSV